MSAAQCRELSSGFMLSSFNPDTARETGSVYAFKRDRPAELLEAWPVGSVERARELVFYAPDDIDQVRIILSNHEVDPPPPPPPPPGEPL